MSGERARILGNLIMLANQKNWCAFDDAKKELFKAAPCDHVPEKWDYEQIKQYPALLLIWLDQGPDFFRNPTNVSFLSDLTNIWKDDNADLLDHFLKNDRHERRVSQYKHMRPQMGDKIHMILIYLLHNERYSGPKNDLDILCRAWRTPLAKCKMAQLYVSLLCSDANQYADCRYLLLRYLKNDEYIVDIIKWIAQYSSNKIEDNHFNLQSEPIEKLYFLSRFGQDLRRDPVLYQRFSALTVKFAKNCYNRGYVPYLQLALSEELQPHISDETRTLGSISDHVGFLTGIRGTLLSIPWHNRLGGIDLAVRASNGPGVRDIKVPRRISKILLLLARMLLDANILGRAKSSVIQLDSVLHIIRNTAQEALDHKRFWGVRSKQTTAVYTLLTRLTPEQDFGQLCVDSGKIDVIAPAPE